MKGRGIYTLLCKLNTYRTMIVGQREGWEGIVGVFLTGCGGMNICLPKHTQIVFKSRRAEETFSTFL